MMSGHFHPIKELDRAMSSTTLTDRMSKSAVSSTSPLKIFGNAKKKIRDVFVEVAAYVEESKEFLKNIDDDRVISAEGRVKVGEYTDKVSGIREVLSRDHMKVVFFGRTSNGKSTVINTMLRSKILPSGIGHTTHCFLQVEGSDSPEGYMLLEGSPEKRPVSSLKDLANALSSVKLDENSLIRICWPKDKCSLLRDDVVLVDSPGIDVSPNLDSWIDKFCLDADVFVLVANAESTLMQTEKNFFLKVSDKLSKPTLFILNNRWDASASEPEMMEMVRSQHMERNIEFLCSELKVVTTKEAEDRIFFVSAKEALHNRMTEAGAVTTPLGAMLEGYQSRLYEFASFERTFEECISRSAVKTKFAQHACKGKQMTCELKEIMDTIHERCQALRGKLVNSRSHSGTKLSHLETQLAEISGEVENSIRTITDDVQLKVSRALSDEIRRLYELVGEFQRPFHSDPMFIEVYKRELHLHVENGLGAKVQARCSSALDELVHVSEQHMAERLLNMLPAEKQEAARSHINAKPNFSVEYRLDAKNLCADFKENVTFQFSYSPFALLSKYTGRPITFTAFWSRPPNPEHIRVGMSPPPSVSSLGTNSLPTAPAPPANGGAGGGDIAVTLLRMAPILSSTTTLSCIGAAVMVSRYVGWKVFAVVGGVYGTLYIYERLMWSNRAKERAFKSQYVEYAGSKLKLIVDMTSANASHQVQQELTGTYSRLKHDVNVAKEELRKDIEGMDGEVERLDKAVSRAKVLKNKATWLDNEINEFISRFIDYA